MLTGAMMYMSIRIKNKNTDTNFIFSNIEQFSDTEIKTVANRETEDSVRSSDDLRYSQFAYMTESRNTIENFSGKERRSSATSPLHI